MSRTAQDGVPTRHLNLNTARVFVRDLTQARIFYRDQLGLPVNTQDAAHGVVVFNAGNCELVVQAVAPDAPPAQQARVGRACGLSFRVPNLHVAHQDLVSRGVVFSAAPQRQFWGGTVATFRDPDGNEFELVQRG